jgi:hypothetical protein
VRPSIRIGRMVSFQNRDEIRRVDIVRKEAS